MGWLQDAGGAASSATKKVVSNPTVKNTWNTVNNPIPQQTWLGGPAGTTLNKGINLFNQANSLGVKSGLAAGAIPLAAGLAGGAGALGTGLLAGGLGAAGGLAAGALPLLPGIAGGVAGIAGLNYLKNSGLGTSFLPQQNSSNSKNGQYTSYQGSQAWDDLNNRIKNQQYQGAFDRWGNPTSSKFNVNAAPWVNQGPDSITDNYKQMIDEGKSDSLSRWGAAAYGRSRADQGFALEDARQQAMGNAAGNMNTLAMQGGLEGGAAENMMRQAQRDANNARTNIYRQGQMDRMGIDVADAARKDQMRTQGLAGSLDAARYDTDVQNINVQNRIRDLGLRNDFAAGQLGMEGKMAAARAAADAMAASGQSSGSGGTNWLDPFGTTDKVKNWFNDWNWNKLNPTTWKW